VELAGNHLVGLVDLQEELDKFLVVNHIQSA
jgi:hypothetical protein